SDRLDDGGRDRRSGAMSARIDDHVSTVPGRPARRLPSGWRPASGQCLTRTGGCPPARLPFVAAEQATGSRPIAGRRAVVTGGLSGIGAATTALLRSRGAQVAVLDREPA